MSSEVGRRVTARRAWLVALASGTLAAGSAASAAQGQTPDKVIDAGSNADQAAQALNEGCADMEKCDWKSDDPGDLKTKYGTARIIGDVLYNCSAAGSAQTAVGVTDERGESTSVSESISLEISLGFLDLEKASVDFEAFSKQSESFSTQVKVQNYVTVPPGYKGWTDASMLQGNVTGSAYVTQGIHLIQVKNIDLQFPGYQGPDWTGSKDAQVVYSGTAQAMTADEAESRCAAVGAATASRAQAARAARVQVARKERFKITVCRSKRTSARSSQPGRRRCSKRTVTGVRPPRLHFRKVTAKLTRAGRVYAAETNRRGGIRLTQRRNITPGRYTLIVRKKPKKMIVRHHGKRLHRARQHMITIVPITIRWTRG